MTRTRTNQNIILASLLALGALAACGGDEGGPTQQPEEGHAFLTIVGDRNVFVNGGQRQTLTVKYHDDDGTPLAGSVKFKIDGDAKGASLSKASGTTNSEGKVTLELIAGTGSEASFRVVAEADYATAVDWRVAVGEGTTGPLRLEGTYEIESIFDLTGNLQGNVGGPIKDFLSAWDGVMDPLQFIVDEIVKAAGGTPDAGVQAVIGAGVLAIETALQTAIPTEYNALKRFGRNMNALVKRFGLKTKVEILSSASDGNYTARLTIHALTVRFEHATPPAGTEPPPEVTVVEFGADLGIDDIVIENVAITRDASNNIVIADHALNLKFGTLLIGVINEVVIPELMPVLGFEPADDKLGLFLSKLVRCAGPDPTLGSAISSNPTVKNLINTACGIGVQLGAGLLIAKLNTEVGTALAFQIHGTVRGVDMNNDKVVDKMQAGRWEGTVTIGATTTPLSGDQPFLGLRAATP